MPSVGAQDLDGFDEEAERQRQSRQEAGGRSRSPSKQGRGQPPLGPGPLASGLTPQNSNGSSAGGPAYLAFAAPQQQVLLEYQGYAVCAALQTA